MSKAAVPVSPSGDDAVGRWALAGAATVRRPDVAWQEATAGLFVSLRGYLVVHFHCWFLACLCCRLSFPETISSVAGRR